MEKQTAVDKFHDAVNDMIARRRPMTSNEVAQNTLILTKKQKKIYQTLTEQQNVIVASWIFGEQQKQIKIYQKNWQQSKIKMKVAFQKRMNCLRCVTITTGNKTFQATFP